jgi:hypothetical protein
MALGLAYCVEFGEVIDLEQAKYRYFLRQPDERKRFIFICADPLCRDVEELTPLINGINYDKEDIPDQKKNSAHFRSDPRHKHIDGCTWMLGTYKREEPEGSAKPAQPRGSALESEGLNFRPGSDHDIKAEPILPIKKPPRTKEPDAVEPSTRPPAAARPDTVQYIRNVGQRYLGYSDHERKTIPLLIGGKNWGTFDEVCLPIGVFHPKFQSKRIYFGRVSVIELTNVFYIKFKDTMRPNGQDDEHWCYLQIKMVKSWLDNNDRVTKEILSQLAVSKQEGTCFFYIKSPPRLNKPYLVEFDFKNRNNICVISDKDSIPVRLREVRY